MGHSYDTKHNRDCAKRGSRRPFSWKSTRTLRLCFCHGYGTGGRRLVGAASKRTHGEAEASDGNVYVAMIPRTLWLMWWKYCFLVVVLAERADCKCNSKACILFDQWLTPVTSEDREAVPWTWEVMSAKINASKGKDSCEVIKSYHKQAFEYISKALRIDEDDTGALVVFKSYQLMCCGVWQLVTNPSLWRQERKRRLCSGTRKASLNLNGVSPWRSREEVTWRIHAPLGVAVSRVDTNTAASWLQGINMTEPRDFKIKWSTISPWRKTGSRC